jgi:hypothetical protein
MQMKAMQKMKAVCTMIVATMLMAGTAQVKAQSISPGTANGQTASTANFTDQQIITATVHQAWDMSGKNEEVFFGMVTRLAEISAQNRGLTLPDTKAAGERVGNLIKMWAKADKQQLLYAVVDKAVRQVGTPTK